jgi:hypothetical protein
VEIGICGIDLKKQYQIEYIQKSEYIGFIAVPYLEFEMRV